MVIESQRIPALSNYLIKYLTDEWLNDQLENKKRLEKITIFCKLVFTIFTIFCNYFNNGIIILSKIAKLIAEISLDLPIYYHSLNIQWFCTVDLKFLMSGGFSWKFGKNLHHNIICHHLRSS